MTKDQSRTNETKVPFHQNRLPGGRPLRGRLTSLGAASEPGNEGRALGGGDTSLTARGGVRPRSWSRRGAGATYLTPRWGLITGDSPRARATKEGGKGPLGRGAVCSGGRAPAVDQLVAASPANAHAGADLHVTFLTPEALGGTPCETRPLAQHVGLPALAATNREVHDDQGVGRGGASDLHVEVAGPPARGELSPRWNSLAQVMSLLLAKRKYLRVSCLEP